MAAEKSLKIDEMALAIQGVDDATLQGEIEQISGQVAALEAGRITRLRELSRQEVPFVLVGSHRSDKK